MLSHWMNYLRFNLISSSIPFNSNNYIKSLCNIYDCNDFQFHGWMRASLRGDSSHDTSQSDSRVLQEMYQSIFANYYQLCHKWSKVIPCMYKNIVRIDMLKKFSVNISLSFPLNISCRIHKHKWNTIISSSVFIQRILYQMIHLTCRNIVTHCEMVFIINDDFDSV